MNLPYRYQPRWWLWVLLVVIGAGLAILGLSIRERRKRDGYVVQLRDAVQRAGCIVEVGRVERGFVTTTLHDIDLRFAAASGYAARIGELVISTSMLGRPAAKTQGLRFSLKGEPSQLVDNLAVLKRLTTTHLADDYGEVSVDYSHRFFGTLSLEGVVLDSGNSGDVVRARQVSLGGAHWQDVAFTVRRRNQMIELGLGDGPIEDARIHFSYFPPSRGAAQWALTVTRQPLRSLGLRFGWDPGPAFESTTVGGSLTFVVPTDPTMKARGSIQAALDRWPKPDWPEVDALMGNTTSILARIEPSADMTRWNLAKVILSQALYTMEGVGRLDWDRQPRLVIDVEGARNCAQLRAHLPASTHLERVKSYLDLAASGPNDSQKAHEEAKIRLQLSSVNAPAGQQHVAWRLGAGCGLLELTTGQFVQLDLPRISPKAATNEQSAH